MHKAQTRQAKYYNRNIKNQIFQADEVLVLLPTDSNKLMLQWTGPLKVIERIRGNDYKIQLVGRTKTFHANMFKKYWNQEQETGAMVILTQLPHFRNNVRR